MRQNYFWTWQKNHLGFFYTQLFPGFFACDDWPENRNKEFRQTAPEYILLFRARIILILILLQR